MHYTAVVERDKASGVLVGSIVGIPGAHTQGATSDELRANLVEVLALVQEQGELTLDSEFVGILQIDA